MLSIGTNNDPRRIYDRPESELGLVHPERCQNFTCCKELTSPPNWIDTEPRPLHKAPQVDTVHFVSSLDTHNIMYTEKFCSCSAAVSIALLLSDTSYIGYSNGDIRFASDRSLHVGGQCADGLKMVVFIGDEPTTPTPVNPGV